MSEDYAARARECRTRLFPGYDSPLADTDPEFVERFDRFAFGEVPAESSLDEHTRLLAVLAGLMGAQAVDLFTAMAKGALNVGVTPVELKELVYQATPYLGAGRMLPFLYAVHELVEHRLVDMPLAGQATTTEDTRLEAGAQAQVDLFGEHMADFHQSGPEDVRHVNRWLAANCFGDYYTRTGLDLAQREMITLCFLAAQGGCEPQLRSHVEANLRLGNDKAFLVKVVSQLVPYIGYPRCLNALGCIEEVAAAAQDEAAEA